MTATTPPAAPRPIGTPRLVLEPLSPGHAEAALPIFADEETYRYMPGAARTDVAALRDDFARLAGGSARDDERWRNWLVFLRDSGRCVGWVQATQMPDHAYVAYVIATACRGNGYAREATAAVIDALWKAPTLRVVIAQADARNVASQRVAEALGFVRDPGDVESELRGEPTRDVVYRLARPPAR